MIEKEPVGKSNRVRVTFVLPSNLWAERVNLVGEFNDWDTMATPMSRNRSDANWRVTVELEAGRRYSFATWLTAGSGSTTGTRTITSKIPTVRTTRYSICET